MHRFTNVAMPGEGPGKAHWTEKTRDGTLHWTGSRRTKSRSTFHGIEKLKNSEAKLLLLPSYLLTTPSILAWIVKICLFLSLQLLGSIESRQIC